MLRCPRRHTTNIINANVMLMHKDVCLYLCSNFIYSSWSRTKHRASPQPAPAAHSTIQRCQHAEGQQLPGNPGDAAAQGGGCQTSGCKGTTFSHRCVSAETNHSGRNQKALKLLGKKNPKSTDYGGVHLETKRGGARWLKKKKVISTIFNRQ